jgi:hypothetical protein
MLRAHEPLILNWFRARGEISNGAVEGLNNKIRVVTRRSYGFRTFDAMEIALYHHLGRLPEPESTPQILLRKRINRALGGVGGTGAPGFTALHHPLQNCPFAEILDLFDAASEFQEALCVAFQGGTTCHGPGATFGIRNTRHGSYGYITVRTWQRQPVSLAIPRRR